MENVENKVSVLICGEVVNLISSESPSYLQELGRYITTRVDEVVNKSAVAIYNEHKRTLLIALNVADDYYKARARQQVLEIERTQLNQELARLKEENARLTQANQDLERDLEHTRAECEDLAALLEQNANDRVVHLPRPEARKGATS